MIQKRIIFKMFAILLTGACMVACSGSDDDNANNVTPQPQPNPQGGKTVILTGSLSPKSSETTRSVDANGNTKWVVGEMIGVIYQKANNEKAVAEATITLIRGAQNAEFTATLENVSEGTQTVDLIYPYSLATTSGYDKEKLLTQQKGTIADISANWDLATGNDQMKVSGTTATLPSLTLKNQLCICKFTLVNEVDNTQYDFNVSSFAISDGTNSYTITPASATNELTVALLPASDAAFTFTGTSSVLEYGYTYVKEMSAVNSSDDVGRVIAADGKVYDGAKLTAGTHPEYTLNVTKATLVANRFYESTLKMPVVNPVAIIAYVGSETAESGYGHGLALSLKVAQLDYSEPGKQQMQWKTTDGGNDNGDGNQYSTLEAALNARESGYTISHKSGRNTLDFPAFYAALNNTIPLDTENDAIAKSAPSGTSGWFLPSIFQWSQMVKTLSGSDHHLTMGSTTPPYDPKDPDMKGGKYNDKIKGVGGSIGIVYNTTDETEGGYFSSSENSNAAQFTYNSDWGVALAQLKTVWSRVRAAFAF